MDVVHECIFQYVTLMLHANTRSDTADLMFNTVAGTWDFIVDGHIAHKLASQWLFKDFSWDDSG
jgi:hypothetical protein